MNLCLHISIKYFTFANRNKNSIFFMNNFVKTSYKLLNVNSGSLFDDNGWMLDDPNGASASLIRAIYERKQIRFRDDLDGIYRFADWLPISRTLKGSSAPVTFKSDKLAKYLGLNNLYITFNGYFPEVGANMTTCSFKETEAYSVCGRLSENEDRVLVVSSAGNTARAFAKVCSENNIKLLLCVPADNLDALWFDKPINDCVKLVSTECGSDYFDSINIGNIAVKCSKFISEGGAKNIARRDGMSTTVLSAVEKIGAIPDYYFQAVGSGTGAIAAWEANLRFNEDGRFGQNNMKLMVSQNYPFAPMYNAWQADSRAMLPYDDDQARKDASVIKAKVLSNRKPPYSICGGLYDALKSTDGQCFSCTNEESEVAMKIFEDCEGVDIYHASGIATASLFKAVENGMVDKDKIVMLNITGGGERRFKADRDLFYLEPSKVFKINDSEECIIDFVNSLF